MWCERTFSQMNAAGPAEWGTLLMILIFGIRAGWCFNDCINIGWPWLYLGLWIVYTLFYFRVVEFRTREDMQRALRKLNESELDGRILFMKEVSIFVLSFLLKGH